MKRLFFLIPMLVVAGLLFALSMTKMTGHIILSVVGLLLLVAYTVATKKEWKCPALEVLVRISYAVALITGVVIRIAHGITAVSVAHKASAALFVILLAVTEIHKSIKNNLK